MKYIFNIALLLVAGLSVLHGQAPSATVSGPVITFQEVVVDYGTISQGSDAVRVFTFTNTGNEPLVITSIKGQCGCTSIGDSWNKQPIPPGGTGTFTVKYDTSIRVGQFEKKIMVYSNATNGTGGIVEVRVKGNVLPAGVPIPK